jgi:plastocyanin domain-containing protein
MTMIVTPEDKEILLENKKIILDITTGYKPNELKVLYDLHNRIYKTNKTPNPCGSCIRSVIVSLQKALSKVI